MTPDDRRYERIPFFARVTITPGDGGPSVDAHTFDVSLGGVGLTSPRALPVGQVITLAFHLSDGRGEHVVEGVLARVARTSSDEGATTVGAQFLAPPDNRSAPLLARKIMEG